MNKHDPFNPQELERMNNFFGNFGWGADSAYPEGPFRHTMKDRGWWNLTYLEIIKDETFPDDPKYREGWSAKRSAVFLNQTPAQFYSKVDKLLLDLNISPVEIAQLVKQYQKAKAENDMESARARRKELDALIAPVYQALREEGYNKAELRG